MGFSKLFLFFDDPTDPSIAKAGKYDGVVIIKNDARLRRRWKETNIASTNSYVYAFRKSEPSVRQELNVEIAIRLALNSNIDWLLHIDCDELFYTFHGNAPEHFQSLSDRGIGNVIYANYEAIPETIDVQDYFKVVTLFKRNFELLPHLSLSRRQTKVVERISQLPDRFFLGYANGKSAARINNRLLPDGVHRFRSKKAGPSRGASQSERPALGPLICRDAVILHYLCCGFDNFWSKYKTLGAFADLWFKQVDIAKTIGSFHIESRDIISRNSRKVAREFYRNRVVINKTSARRLIEADIACRVKEPAKLLRRLRLP
jgi:hypothetical protein